jgi:hypothetical protein
LPSVVLAREEVPWICPGRKAANSA